MALTEAKSYPAPRPTHWTLFLRNYLPWQFIRFLIINIRMTFMILKSHGDKIKEAPAQTKV